MPLKLNWLYLSLPSLPSPRSRHFALHANCQNTITYSQSQCLHVYSHASAVCPTCLTFLSLPLQLHSPLVPLTSLSLRLPAKVAHVLRQSKQSNNVSGAKAATAADAEWKVKVCELPKVILMGMAVHCLNYRPPPNPALPHATPLRGCQSAVVAAARAAY